MLPFHCTKYAQERIVTHLLAPRFFLMWSILIRKTTAVMDENKVIFSLFGKKQKKITFCKDFTPCRKKYINRTISASTQSPQLYQVIILDAFPICFMVGMTFNFMDFGVLWTIELLGGIKSGDRYSYMFSKAKIIYMVNTWEWFCYSLQLEIIAHEFWGLECVDMTFKWRYINIQRFQHPFFSKSYFMEVLIISKLDCIEMLSS